MRITRRSAVPLIGLGLTGAWPGSGQVYPPGAASGGGGGAFNPTSLITGNGGFWRADMGVTGNPNVTAWADQSAIGTNLTATGNPTFSSTGFNSAKPAISFSGAGSQTIRFTWTAGAFSTTTLSAFLLFQEGASPVNDGRYTDLLGNGSTFDYNNANSFEISNLSPAGNLVTYGNNGYIGNGGSTGPAISANALYLFGITLDGANGSRWSAGAQVGATTAWSTTVGTGTTLFAIGSNPTSSYENFNLAFIGLTYKAMNSTDWGNLKTWSNSNWGTSF